MTAAELLQGVLTIAFGAAAGGLTNAIAIWMLFHPYDARGPWRLKLQGAVPKNRERLARSIGRLVGQRLLTPEDLAAKVSAPEVREAFGAAVEAYANRLLETAFGSLRDTLPPPVFAEVALLVERLGPALARRAADFTTAPEFEESVRRFLARAREELGDRELSEVLTAPQRQGLRSRVEEWAAQASRSAEVERAVHDFVARQFARMAEDRTPLLERLPTGLVAALERAVADYLPVALERLAAALADPTTRERAIRALRQVLERATRDLLVHERLVAKLVVTERTIERVLAGLEAEGVLRLGALLEDPEVRAQVARAINDAVVRFLMTPLAERVAALGDERRQGLERAAGEYILAALRDPATRNRVFDAVERTFEQAERRTWGDLLSKLPPDTAARWLADALATERAQRWIAMAVSQIADALLNRPLGRPRDYLAPDAAARLTVALTESLWVWVQEQVPDIVSQLGVPEMVEEKVRGFSLQRLEELVRSVTQRELDIIIRLGWVLGGCVGAIAFAVSLAVR